MRVDGEGEGDFVVVGEGLRVLAEDVGGDDGDLVGEDIVSVSVADCFALGVKEAGVDGGVEAPGVQGEGEVVADPGDVVGGRGIFEHGVGAAAVGALHVFKFDDGYAGTGGGTEGGRVVDRGSRGRRAELGVGGGGGEEKRGGEGQGEDGAVQAN